MVVWAGFAAVVLHFSQIEAQVKFGEGFKLTNFPYFLTKG